MRYLLLASFLFITIHCSAQKSIDNGYYEYVRLMTEGDSLIRAKDYATAAQCYSDVARVIYNGEPIVSSTAHYYAAFCWAQAHQPDSAFHHLNVLVNINYRNIDDLTQDSNFTSLHNDVRWKGIVAGVTRNAERAAAIEERITFNEDSQEVIFYPLTPQAKKYLHNDTLPFIAVNHNNFRIYFRGNSYTAQRLPELKQAFTRAYHRALDVLELDHYPRGINVLLFEDREEMRALTGSGPKGGFALAADDMVLFNYNEARLFPPFTHELFHLISLRTWGNSNSRLLIEGSAVYAQKECNHLMANSIYSFCAQMKNTNQLFSLEKLVNDFNGAALESDMRAYLQAGGVFKYLLEHYGIDRVQQLWSKGFDAFETIYGFSLAELEKQWLATINAITPPNDVDWDTLFEKGCMEMPARR